MTTEILDIKCSICLDSKESAEFTKLSKCKHCFHKECLQEWKNQCLNIKKKYNCPNCRKKIKVQRKSANIIELINFDDRHAECMFLDHQEFLQEFSNSDTSTDADYSNYLKTNFKLYDIICIAIMEHAWYKQVTGLSFRVYLKEILNYYNFSLKELGRLVKSCIDHVKNWNRGLSYCNQFIKDEITLLSKMI